MLLYSHTVHVVDGGHEGREVQDAVAEEPGLAIGLALRAVSHHKASELEAAIRLVRRKRQVECVSREYRICHRRRDVGASLSTE